MPIYFGSNFAREPFQFDSVGNDWEQESVTRPEGYPLYHYLQTKEGVGEVTVYSRNQAVSDNILSNSHTIELQKGIRKKWWPKWIAVLPVARNQLQPTLLHTCWNVRR